MTILDAESWVQTMWHSHFWWFPTDTLKGKAVEVRKRNEGGNRRGTCCPG